MPMDSMADAGSTKGVATTPKATTSATSGPRMAATGHRDRDAGAGDAGAGDTDAGAGDTAVMTGAVGAATIPRPCRRWAHHSQRSTAPVTAVATPQPTNR